MTQFSDKTDLQTDAYPMPQPSTSAKPGLDDKQKKILGISAAAILLGGAAWAITKNPGTETPSEPQDQAEISTLPEDIDVAGKVTDSMSFNQAFETARDEVGMGGLFSWHGRWYNTFDKEEWSSLSLEQRQEFTEMITQEHLPVKPYHSPSTTADPTPATYVEAPAEPTIIEGHLNGQRVMGLDFDQDGIIDTLVLEGEDGYTYRVVDATGDQGLDTVYRYDPLDGELVGASKIEHPFILTNDQFDQGLEENMPKEAVDSVLEPDDAPVDVHQADDEQDDDDIDTDTNHYLTHSAESDDTYINNGDVRDMDE
ncbi:hypothetical protein M0L20_07470 [Spirosoma sp. RP8]|uniref:Uncharacterized protein n=1 Tax=Spirosoma liriopis TaxID=2937440 RepID=A0ABT0HHP8_9BACT|nr:hypothetical protein [Spirosoma liriopis]MCK8491689.1 hypothetical protein [Spirosoma liriopis]